MVISIFPIDASRGIWSFREQPGTEAVRVRVPPGSRLREVKSVGMLLFVPGSDPLIRLAWSANDTMREASREGGRFSRVAQPRKADICQI